MRPLEPKDFDAVYDIYMEPSVNPYMSREVMDKEGFQSIFEDIIGRDYSWSHENDEAEVIGMATATVGSHITAHVAEIRTLALHPKAQGQGRGKAMMDAILHELKNDGFKRIELWVEYDNKKALRFYEKAGFQVDGRLPKAFKRENSPEYIDHIVMSQIF